MQALENKVEWTESLQLSLWQKRLQQLCLGLNLSEAFKTDEFIHAVWPYPLSKDDAGLDIRKPSLAALKGVGPAGKASMFKDAIFTGLLCPLVDTGEIGVIKLQSVTTSLLEVFLGLGAPALKIAEFLGGLGWGGRKSLG